MTRPTKEGCCSCQAAGPSDPSRPAKKTTGRTSSSRRRRRNRCAGRRFRNSCKWPSHSGRSRHWPRSSRQESSGSPGCQCTASYRVSRKGREIEGEKVSRNSQEKTQEDDYPTPIHRGDTPSKAKPNISTGQALLEKRAPTPAYGGWH